MNKKINFYGFKSLVVTFVFLLISSSVFASTTKERNYSLIVKNLSEKLQSDLASEAVTVKLNNVKEYKISNNQIGLKGEGICILTDANNHLPIRFDVKVDTVNQSVSDIVYEFDESAYAPSSDEEFLMKELMKKISGDYKTDNIVIAIDAFEEISKLNRQKEFAGVGEVRIGDLVWNKIKFDVVVDAENKTAKKIIYKIEK